MVVRWTKRREGRGEKEGGGTQKSEPRARLGISRQNSQGIIGRSECPENRLNFSRLITFVSGAASNGPPAKVLILILILRHIKGRSKWSVVGTLGLGEGQRAGVRNTCRSLLREWVQGCMRRSVCREAHILLRHAILSPLAGLALCSREAPECPGYPGTSCLPGSRVHFQHLLI